MDTDSEPRAGLAIEMNRQVLQLEQEIRTVTIYPRTFSPSTNIECNAVGPDGVSIYNSVSLTHRAGFCSSRC